MKIINKQKDQFYWSFVLCYYSAFGASSTVSTTSSFTVSTVSSTTVSVVSTAGASSGASATSTGSSTKSSFNIISAFSILAPIYSLVLESFPTLSLK